MMQLSKRSGLQQIAGNTAIIGIRRHFQCRQGKQHRQQAEYTLNLTMRAKLNKEAGQVKSAGLHDETNYQGNRTLPGQKEMKQFSQDILFQYKSTKKA